METPLATYKKIVQEQAALAEADFQNLIAKGQQGDENALRQIAASCLKSCLNVVEQRFPQLDDAKQLDMLQEANAAMMGAIATFPGKKIPELTVHIEQAIIRHLQAPGI